MKLLKKDLIAVKKQKEQEVAVSWHWACMECTNCVSM